MSATQLLVLCRVILLGLLCLLSACVRPTPEPRSTLPATSVQSLPLNRALADRVLALDAERVTAQDIALVLTKCPAPRIFNFNGSAFRTMDEFSGFLMDMGYPES